MGLEDGSKEQRGKIRGGHGRSAVDSSGTIKSLLFLHAHERTQRFARHFNNFPVTNQNAPLC